MKKSMIVLAAVLLLFTLCLTACNDHSGEMRDINLLLRKDYSKIDVTVTTVNNGYMLEDVYSFENVDGQTNVTYVITRLNSFESSNGTVTAPDEITTKYEGSAVVQDGTIISVKGEPITPEALQSVSFTGMSFKVPYFTKKFLGNDGFDGTDMHVVVRYTQDGIHRIVLTYAGVSGSEVSIVYVLTK